MKLKPLFPDVPAELSDLSPDELTALEQSFKARAKAIATYSKDQSHADAIGDADFSASLADPDNGTEIVQQMTDGVVALERIRAELGSRAEAEATFTSTVDDLAAQFGIEDETDEPGAELEAAADSDDAEAQAAADAAGADDEGAEAAGAPDPEAAAAEVETTEAPAPVVASAKPRLRRPPAAPPSHRPRAAHASEAATPLLASAGFETVMRPGQPVDRDGLVALFGEAQASLGRPSSGKDKVIVASARTDYPEERRLENRDMHSDWERIQGVTSETAVLASGGFCAPFTPRYDLPIVAVADRPVRDAMASFQATRGGITYPTPLGLSDVIDGITVVTAAQDEAGGSSSIKNCVVIDCDEFLSAAVEAIAACVEHGNLNARAWPERVANVSELLAAAHAQVADGQLLAEMTAGSTNVVDTSVYGAYSTIIQGVLKGAAAYRSRHRMRPTTRLRVLFPAWLPQMIAADLAHNGFTRLDPEAAQDRVEQLLSRAGVNVSWYLDQDGTTQQVFGSQAGSGADLLNFLPDVVWYLFHEGAWLFLDMGRLDLGIVRDSSLNSTNDFEIFWETFEGSAMIGVESLRINSSVCPSGSSAAAQDPADFFECADVG